MLQVADELVRQYRGEGVTRSLPFTKQNRMNSNAWLSRLVEIRKKQIADADKAAKDKTPLTTAKSASTAVAAASSAGPSVMAASSAGPSASTAGLSASGDKPLLAEAVGPDSAMAASSAGPSASTAGPSASEP